MAKGRRTGGRKPGAHNKRTVEVKTALETAFDQLGGVPALVRFGQARPDLFYPIWAKLLPRDLAVKHSGKLTLEELVAGSQESG